MLCAEAHFLVTLSLGFLCLSAELSTSTITARKIHVLKSLRSVVLCLKIQLLFFRKTSLKTSFIFPSVNPLIAPHQPFPRVEITITLRVTFIGNTILACLSTSYISFRIKRNSFSKSIGAILRQTHDFTKQHLFH